MGKAKASKAGAAAVTSAVQPAAVSWDDQSLWQRASYVFAQYIGLAFAISGPLFLYLCYDQGYMHNTAVTLTCFVLCLIGLFFHETRPFNVQGYVEEQQEKAKAEAEEKKSR